MIWRELPPEDVFELRCALIIDVRSPAEFAAEKIPGALNVPLLSDDERRRVGIVYKEQGELSARRHALKYISPKVPSIIDELINGKKHGQPVVVYCWRGGLRSEAVASLLSIAGISCWRITGGFKAWRSMVLKDLQEDRYPFEPVVLHGMTGSGKTEILHELAKLGCQILDLESLANHRGSMFGGLGLSGQPGQKDFESELWCNLRSFRTAPVFLEAESRRVGKLSLPNCVFSRIGSGQSVLVHKSVAQRAAALSREYIHSGVEDLTAEGLQLLDGLRQFISRKLVDEIARLVRAGKFEAAIALLLTEYYDPLYLQSLKNHGSFNFEVCSDDAVAAATAIAHRFSCSVVH